MERGKASGAKVSCGGGGRLMPEIPEFSGEDAYLWVSRVDQYFRANPAMNDRDKFRAVLAALEGRAFNWYQFWKKYTDTPATWSYFKDAVVRRFQPEAADYPLLVLLNIRQTGTVAEYRDLFETLIHSEPLRLPHLNLGEEISRAIFLKGLREDLNEQLRSHEVKSLSDLMDMAQLIEEENRAEEDVGPGPRGNPLMKLWGEIAGRKVMILVASGASDSRIAKKVVKELGLLVCESDELFQFAVGPPVKSKGVCRGVKLKVHEELEMTCDFFVFESLGGNEDIVLGYDWLRRLGTIAMNLRKLTMRFVVAGKEITLKGDPSLTPPDEMRISLMTRLNI